MRWSIRNGASTKGPPRRARGSRCGGGWDEGFGDGAKRSSRRQVRLAAAMISAGGVRVFSAAGAGMTDFGLLSISQSSNANPASINAKKHVVGRSSPIEVLV